MDECEEKLSNLWEVFIRKCKVVESQSAAYWFDTLPIPVKHVAAFGPLISKNYKIIFLISLHCATINILCYI